MVVPENRRQASSVELADVFKRHGEKYRAEHTLTPEQHKVMNAVINCRNAALGGHVEQCEQCEATKIAYNSCRNRHCPKCQSIRTARWLESRREELLPVQYFHLVFTLPHELNHLILYNKAALYNTLFQAAWETLNTLGQSPTRLNGQMGMIGILHTWGQNLSVHNHLHCIVPGGALTKMGRWRSSKRGYLFPVKVMSKLFRGFYISKLRALQKSGELKFPDTLPSEQFSSLLDTLMEKAWVVYSKEPFGGPEKLLDYLGRYTHKIAISNHRILHCDDNSVTFQWRDYADGNQVKAMTLKPDEFIRRYLNHVLPKGFMRIRFFGILASACKKKKVEIVRSALSYTISKLMTSAKATDIKTIMQILTGVDISVCTACGKGKLRTIQRLPTKFGKTVFDTS